MHLSPEELERIFDSSFPAPIQQALVQAVFNTYDVAYEHCTRFHDEEARDFRGHYRWIHLRDQWRGLSGRFPVMQASAEKYHTLLQAGQMKLTACSLRQVADPIKFAYYRQEYALESNLNLFTPEEPLPDDGYIYGIFIHGVDLLEPRQPGFGRVVFPTADLETRIHEIDLFNRFGELVLSLRTPVDPQVEPNIRIRPRKDRKQK